MPDHSATSQASWSWRVDVAVVLAFALLSIGRYFRGLGDEPYFIDEGAMFAQSYYWRLYSAGDWHHPHWVLYPAFDHPPLSKYLFGLSLDLAGLAVPQDLGPWVTWMGGDFFSHDSRQIATCRIPTAIFGAGGVMFAYVVGRLLQGRTTGILAASLLLACPLYYTHARRAMGDVMTEASTLATIALALAAVRLASRNASVVRVVVTLAGLSVAAALAPLAKLNGAMAPVFVELALGLVFFLALTLRKGAVRVLLVLVLVPPLSFGLFTFLNPTLFARPSERAIETDPYGMLAVWRTEEPDLLRQGPVRRALYLVKFRARAMREGAQNFPADQLKTPLERLYALWFEGCGRYSPLAWRLLEQRSDRGRKYTVVEYTTVGIVPWLWGPLVLVGVLSCFTAGREAVSRGELPAEWVMFVYAGGVIAVLGLTVPLRWDRYFLPLQTVAVVVVPFGVFRVVRWFYLGLVLNPPIAQEGDRERD